MSIEKKIEYENSRVAVDAAIFTILDGSLRVFLKPREKDPDEGKLELLGGLIQSGETAEETLLRKVRETIPELDTIYFEQFFTFTNPKRDPRARTISIGFFALVPAEMLQEGGYWHDVATLKTLAFDHLTILTAARKKLSELGDISIARYILPRLFRLNELHQTIEILNGARYDNRNFRRMALASGKIVATAKKDDKGAFRPAQLFRFLEK